MQNELTLFSVDQATQHNQFGYECPLDRVALVRTPDKGMAWRVTLNPDGFERDYAKGWMNEKETLRFVYGEGEDKTDALQKFSRIFENSLQRDEIPHFKESATSFLLFCPPDKQGVLDRLHSIKDYDYRGPYKVYESYHGENYAELRHQPLLTQMKRIESTLDRHTFKLENIPLQKPLISALQLVEDGNALVGVTETGQYESRSNPAAVDQSVYAAVFHPQSPEQLAELEKAVMRAAHLVPDWHEDHYRPNASIKEERRYESPPYWLVENESGEVAAREQYISIHDGTVVLREITLHDLQALMQELHQMGVVEANEQIAAEIHAATQSEFRGPEKFRQYDGELDPYDDILLDAFYNHYTLQEHDYDAGALLFGSDRKIEIRRITDQMTPLLSNAHWLRTRGDAEGDKALTEVFDSVRMIAHMSVKGTIILVDQDGQALFPPIKSPTPETQARLIRERFDAIMGRVVDIESGKSLEEMLEAMQKRYWNDQFQRVSEHVKQQMEAVDQKINEAGGFVAWLSKDTQDAEHLHNANKSEWERAGHRIKPRAVDQDKQIALHRPELPAIPLFAKRRQLANEPKPFVPMSGGRYAHYTPQLPGHGTAPHQLDAYLPGLEDKYQQYLLNVQSDKAQNRLAV